MTPKVASANMIRECLSNHLQVDGVTLVPSSESVLLHQDWGECSQYQTYDDNEMGQFAVNGPFFHLVPHLVRSASTVKDGQVTVVQAKRWKGSVGPEAIQETYAGKAHYKADAAIVVTNSRFTQEARRLALSTAVILWGRDKLKKEILADRSQPESKSAPKAAAEESISN